MTLDKRSHATQALATALVVLVVSFFFVPDVGAEPDIKIRVSDTTSLPGTPNTVISVFMDNNHYTIAGFNIWLQLDRPDILLFQTDIDSIIDTTRWKCIQVGADPCGDSIHVQGDTIWWRCDRYEGSVCMDSTNIPADSAVGCSDCWGFEADWDFFYVDTIQQMIGNIDRTGTLTQNWEWVDARSKSGVGVDLNIAGIADLSGFPFTPGIPPQQGGLLVKLWADVLDVPDTILERSVNIIIQKNFVRYLNFARPDGSSIGQEYIEVPDTNYWVCDLWAGQNCMSWVRVTTPPADSTAYGVDTVARIDEDKIWLYDGSMEVLMPPEGYCGDVDGQNPPDPDIADLVYLVNYMFKAGPPPVAMWTANVDCLGGDDPDIADLVYLVNYMFKNGPPICPTC